jgi:hypothetical protein
MKNHSALALSLVLVLLTGCGLSNSSSAVNLASSVDINKPGSSSSSSGSSSSSEPSSIDESSSSFLQSSSHNYSSAWSYDATYHWHACSDEGCSSIIDKTAHNFGEVTITYDKVTGQQIEERTCSDCHYLQSKNHTHTLSEYEYDEEMHWKTCPVCKESFSYGRHDWSDWVTDKEVTESVPGEKHRTCSVCSYKMKKTLYYGVEYTDNGNFFKFGRYPQSRVTDETTLSSLGSFVSNDSTWQPYPYFINHKKQDFMLYKDTLLNGSFYRGVYFSEYRPYFTTLPSTTDDTLQDNNGYIKKNTYWFKYEPIRWRILSMAEGTAFLLSDDIIDSQHYNTWDGKDNPDGYDYRKYDTSDIRAWLNSTFYDLAFSSTEQAKILTTTVDNSLESTGLESSTHLCDNTNDKVYLLSRKESLTKSYGFSNNIYTIDPARYKNGSDYAICQGLQVRTKENGSPLDSGSSPYFLRTPGNDSTLSAFYVNEYGKAHANNEVCFTCIGTVPAIRITM